MRQILILLSFLSFCYISYGQVSNIRFEYTGLSNHARPALIIEKLHIPSSDDFPMAANEWGRKNSKTKLPEHCIQVSAKAYNLIKRYTHKKNKKTTTDENASLTIVGTTDGTDKKLNMLDREAAGTYITQLEQLLTKKKLDKNELQRIVDALEELR